MLARSFALTAALVLVLITLALARGLAVVLTLFVILSPVVASAYPYPNTLYGKGGSGQVGRIPLELQALAPGVFVPQNAYLGDAAPYWRLYHISVRCYVRCNT